MFVTIILKPVLVIIESKLYIISQALTPVFVSFFLTLMYALLSIFTCVAAITQCIVGVLLGTSHASMITTSIQAAAVVSSVFIILFVFFSSFFVPIIYAFFVIFVFFVFFVSFVSRV